MSADPIMVPCVGSGTEGTPIGIDYMCNMCGAMFWSFTLPDHERMDLLAMIGRGDFDEPA